MPELRLTAFAPPRHKKWEQASGYFDGDGTVTLRVQKFTLEFGLQFADGFRAQLDQLKSFLLRKGVTPGGIIKNSYEEMYVLPVSENRSLLMAAKNMLPFFSKKAAELEALINYMENRIDGNQAVDIFNQMVVQGERIGKLRKVDLPFRLDEGLAIARRMAHEGARIKNAKLTFQDQTVIQARSHEGESVRVLAKEFKVSESTILKALHGGYKQFQSSANMATGSPVVDGATTQKP
jgi:hypothetical protein